MGLYLCPLPYKNCKANKNKNLKYVCSICIIVCLSLNMWHMYNWCVQHLFLNVFTLMTCINVCLVIVYFAKLNSYYLYFISQMANKVIHMQHMKLTHVSGKASNGAKKCPVFFCAKISVSASAGVVLIDWIDLYTFICLTLWPLTTYGFASPSPRDHFWWLCRKNASLYVFAYNS